MLLQNPVADIPPFLVAAEAQRRQAIRQQFAGSAPKESVVDSLTKQLANVPQNIQAPAQTPVNIPQTPQMQGVMALQNQPQQQPQQQMRDGGMVQRYQVGGTVQPQKTEPMWRIPYVGDWVGSTFGGIYDWATTPYSRQTGEETADNFDVTLPNVDLGKVSVPEEYKVLPPAKVTAPPPKVDPGKKNTSEENKSKDVQVPDKFRSRIEELYASQEPSDWEKAQRWFAMAEQFFDPSKTTGQSIAGAGRAFAEMTGEQSRAQREAELSGKRAMLEYDMTLEEQRRAAAAAAAKDQLDFEQRMKERGTPSADAAVSAITRSMMDIDERIAKLGETEMPDMPIAPEKQAEIDRLRNARSNLNKQLVTIMERGGFVNRTLVTEDELAGLGPL
jgi:hypothetical protein